MYYKKLLINTIPIEYKKILIKSVRIAFSLHVENLRRKKRL